MEYIFQTEDFQQMGIPFGGLIIFEDGAEVFGDALSKAYLLGNPNFLSNFAKHHSQQEGNIFWITLMYRTIFLLFIGQIYSAE